MVEIAIIEDNLQHLSNLKKLINEQPDLNCKITETQIGFFFEKLSLQDPPDILILDILLKNGISLDHLHKLRVLLPRTRFMIHSELTDDEFIIQALKNGINAFLVKGCTDEQFISTLQLLMEGEDFIDPMLSKKLIHIFRQELTQEHHPGLGHFDGLLNSREMQVLKGLTKGKQYKEIAADLYLSINTVRHYVKSIYRKLEVNNRAQLVGRVRGGGL